MICNVIGTGSTGNAVLVNDEVLIDCGLPFKQLVGILPKLRIVLLTHRHGDHFKPSAVRAIHMARPAVRFACCAWMVPLLVDAGVSENQIDVVMDNGSWYSYADGDGGELLISAFRVTHDVPNCAWRLCFVTPEKTEKAIYVTDCGNLNGVTAPNYDLYLIEANHGEAEIEEKIAEKKAAGEFAYERRAKDMHLSREQAEAFIGNNAGPNSRYIYLHRHVEKEESA